MSAEPTLDRPSRGPSRRLPRRWQAIDGRHERSVGFTIVELMGVLLLIALASGVAAVSLRSARRNAAPAEAAATIAWVDAAMRDATRAAGRAAPLSIDLARARFVRGEPESVAPATLGVLPASVRVEQVAFDDQRVGYGWATIRYASGRSPSFACLLAGPGGRREWVIVAGGTGQLTRLNLSSIENESTVDDILRQPPFAPAD